MGTPYYASPEQARGDRGLDARSDIYSLGATFYHIITGRVPFEAENPLEVLRKHVSESLVSPRRWNPAIAPQVEQMVSKMMKKAPEERFQTPKDLFREVERVRAALGA